MFRRLALLTSIALVGTVPAALHAQKPYSRGAVPAAQYARAERFLGYSVDSLVYGASVRPTWLANDRFWYRNTTAQGAEFIVVDPNKRTRAPAFDHAKLAAALSKASDTTYDAWHLPFYGFDYANGGKAITFTARRASWTCDLAHDTCTAKSGGTGRGEFGNRDDVLSPDGTKAAFIRDDNLWMRDVASGAETQLTTDGMKDFGYATNNAGWTRSDRPVLVWSPDSRKIATFQQDERGDGKMYLVHTAIGHPTLDAWNYPLPGDSIITTIQRVIIDLSGPKVIRLQMPPDQHRSTICDHVYCGGTWADVEWSPDASELIFVSTSRNHHHEWLRIADAGTGAVRTVMEESDSMFYQSGVNHVNWHALPQSHELIWYSNRTNWGHLYLYDLDNGQLKNAITSGDWNVLQVRRIDAEHRTIYFTGAGREPGDPYFQYFYSVRFDGSHLTLLTPDSADHEITLSPSGDYFLDSYSTPTTPPLTVVRDLRGRVRVRVEQADISALLATGWKPPVPFTVKARDGKTDLYGLMFVPTHLDSTKKYPIVNHIYPGPQTGSVGSRTFEAARGDAQALAELGFVVVELDALGTPMRSHSFQGAWYGDMGDNGLPDQVAGMKQLAERYPWIDIDRAGIYGHSGGGFATADAMFRYPDFFKVGIAEAGNHDNRDYEDDWGEMWQGLLVRHPDGSTNYDNQANELVARNLKGKLLLAYGTTDDNVPPYNTLLVVDSLIAANKDFDLLPFPNRRHGFGNEPYMIRRRWDYFVENLLGATPPPEFQLTPPDGGGRFRRF